MNRKDNCRSLLVVTLLLSLLQLPSSVAAEEARTWSILGVDIDDKVLFDADYFRQSVEESKHAVVENINYEYIDGEVQRIDVEPVIFSDIYIPAKRFIGLPIVCGKYRSSKSELVYRYIFLGSTAFTVVEEKNKFFELSWGEYCGRA